MDSLRISDDFGNPIIDEREKILEENKSLLIMLITADRIFENLLPLHFVFRPDFFNKDKVVGYVNFCMAFLQRDKKFLLTQSWNKKEESPNFVFVNKITESGDTYKAVAFKHGLGITNGVMGSKSYEYSFSKTNLYSIVDKKLLYVTSDEFVILELQKMLMSLITFWFGKTQQELDEVLLSYGDIIIAAEFFISNSIVVEYAELSSKKYTL